MTQTRYLPYIEKAAGLLLLIYPTLMLSVKGGMNGAFLFILLLAFAVWIKRPDGIGTVVWQREFTIYSVAMVALTVAILISQVFHQHYTTHPYDAASRYWLAIPVFLLLHRLRQNVISVLQFSFPVAAITGFLLSKDMSYSLGRSGSGIATLDVIHFGNFELILGMMSLFSINWFATDKLPLRILKILGFIAGVAASVASGSRGGWLAIPVFIAIFIYFKMARISPKVIFSIAIAATLGFILIFSVSAIFNQRMNELVNDITMYEKGNRDSSIGVRWQLYKAAVDVFSHHPIVGVGPEGFASEMSLMLDSGKVSPHVAELGRAEVHNDILSKAVGMGLFGLIAIFAIYLVPLRLFWLSMKSDSEPIKKSGLLGFTFVSGFIIFGLTAETLNLTMAAAFYSFTVAVLLAACFNTHMRERVLRDA